MRRRWSALIRTRLPAFWRCAARNEGEFRQACVAAAAAGDERDVELVVQILAAQERGRASNDGGRRQGLGDKFAPRHWARWCRFRRKFHVVTSTDTSLSRTSPVPRTGISDRPIRARSASLIPTQKIPMKRRMTLTTSLGVGMLLLALSAVPAAEPF